MAAATSRRAGVVAERMHNLHWFRDVSKAIQRRSGRQRLRFFKSLFHQPEALMSERIPPSGQLSAQPQERFVAAATSGYRARLPLLARNASAVNRLWWPGLAS
jgi:hypothetical protein